MDRSVLSISQVEVKTVKAKAEKCERYLEKHRTVQFLGLLCSRECCNMYTQRLTPSAGFLQQKSGLLRGHAKKLKLRIQLMLAVVGAQFQVTESPLIAEVKRRLATCNCPCCQQAMGFMGIHISDRPTSSLIIA
jgi:hypothetical protein